MKRSCIAVLILIAAALALDHVVIPCVTEALATESVEVKDNKDGTATVTMTVSVQAGKNDTASVLRQRALVAASAMCVEAARAERMTDSEIEAARVKEVAEAEARAARLKALKGK